MLVVHGGGATLTGAYGTLPVSADAVAILPPGEHGLSLASGGLALVLATDRPDLPVSAAINAGEPDDGRIAPTGVPYARAEPLRRPWISLIADIAPPAGNPRLRFLQSATMSINLVAYDGPRGKTALSPHKHADIQQGTLAIAGDYVHHLRTPWGKDANQWIADVHLPAAPGTLLLIPPELIHTTEGVGDTRHVLIDIFAPVRRDFRDKGWIANAGDYAPPPS
ncbi:MAG: hypothetical protein DI547_02095 [Sphingobium sp.]|nr:MAG: hypothetical protein DI547_02095 [Sphingobium sp.]